MTNKSPRTDAYKVRMPSFVSSDKYIKRVTFDTILNSDMHAGLRTMRTSVNRCASSHLCPTAETCEALPQRPRTTHHQGIVLATLQSLHRNRSGTPSLQAVPKASMPAGVRRKHQSRLPRGDLKHLSSKIYERGVLHCKGSMETHKPPQPVTPNLGPDQSWHCTHRTPHYFIIFSPNRGSCRCLLVGPSTHSVLPESSHTECLRKMVDPFRHNC